MHDQKCADIRMRYLGVATPTSTTVGVTRLAGPDFMNAGVLQPAKVGYRQPEDREELFKGRRFTCVISAVGQGRLSSPGRWDGRYALSFGNAVCTGAVTLGASNGPGRARPKAKAGAEAVELLTHLPALVEAAHPRTRRRFTSRTVSGVRAIGAGCESRV
jgi:hypothetical protein